MFGDIIKVTPTSKVVGDMAIMMVTSGLTPEAVLDPAVEVAFPESVVQLFRGELGQPLGGFPAELQKKVLAGRKPLTAGRASSCRRRISTRSAPRPRPRSGAPSPISSSPPISCIRRCSRITPPTGRFGDVSILPTSVFFYGMQPGQEINIDLERGKTLIVQLRGDAAMRTRTARAPCSSSSTASRARSAWPTRARCAKRPPRRKAEAGNPKHVGAPMPGTIGTVSARAGQSLARGDTLLTLEPMKMETTVRAEQDGVVKEVLAKPGRPVDAKDLLVVFD